MNDRVVEILVYIMAEIHGKQTQPEQLELISRDLEKKGYTQLEISSAFSWLFDRFQDSAGEPVGTTTAILPQSFRVLSDSEKLVFSTGAFGYLLQLRRFELINDFELELVIEKAMMLGGTKITDKEIKALVATVLFSPEGLNERMLLLYDDSEIIH